MFACIVLLILLLPLTMIHLVVDTHFSTSVLRDMGICLDHPQEEGSPLSA